MLDARPRQTRRKKGAQPSRRLAGSRRPHQLAGTHRSPFAARRHLHLHARAGCRSPASIRGSPASPPPRSHRLSLAGRDVLPPFSVALPPLVARAPATLPRLHLPSHDLRPASATPRCLHARANCRSPPCCRILSWPLCPPPAAATTRFLRLPQ